MIIFIPNPVIPYLATESAGTDTIAFHIPLETGAAPLLYGAFTAFIKVEEGSDDSPEINTLSSYTICLLYTSDAADD